MVGLMEWGGEGMGGGGGLHPGGKQSNYRQAIGMTRRDYKPGCGILGAHTASQAGMKTMLNDLCLV